MATLTINVAQSVKNGDKKYEILDFNSTYIETKFLQSYFVNSKKAIIRDSLVRNHGKMCNNSKKDTGKYLAPDRIKNTPSPLGVHLTIFGTEV